MKYIDRTVISKYEPKTTDVMWVFPTENGETELRTFVNGKWKTVTDESDAYRKPQDGIPESDLSPAVKNTLDSADISAQIVNNKDHKPAQFSGLGRVNLTKNIQTISGVEKNVLTQDMFYRTVDGQRVPNTNTIFVIQYDYDLNDPSGENPITIPEGCVLKFDGGSIKNGKIVGSNTNILEMSPLKIFDETLSLSGTWNFDYIIPEWFGAIGDSRTDDTAVLRHTLYISDSVNKEIFFTPGKTYLISDSLNYYNGEYHDYIIKFNSISKFDKNDYVNSKVSATITWNNKLSIIKDYGITVSGGLRGYIKNLRLIGIADGETYLFNNCNLYEFTIDNCHIARLGAVFYDTSVYHLSELKNSILLTVYYLSKLGNRNNISFVDSSISNNYINGGREEPDRNCMEWVSFNGSTITNNFFDYYRVIYFPKSKVNVSCQMPLSIANQYQVFRYFYLYGDMLYETGDNDKTQSLEFYSNGDSFNHTDPSQAPQTSFLHSYGIIKGKARNVSTDYAANLPPFIFCLSRLASVSITNAKIESGVGCPIIFLRSPDHGYINNFTVSKLPTNLYEYTLLKQTIVEDEIETEVDVPSYLYNGFGSQEVVDIVLNTNYIFKVTDGLPTFTRGWCYSVNGLLVWFNGVTYKATNIFDETQNKFVAKWMPISGEATILKGTSGTTSNRNSLQNLNIGFCYFDTTLNQPLWWNGTAWVDASGTVVS